jgi:hypothetical protein
MNSWVSKFLLTLAATAILFSSARAADTPSPDIIPNFQKACDTFAQTMLMLKQNLPNVKSGAELAPLIRQWADANGQFISAVTKLTTAYPTPPAEYKPAIEKMNLVIKGECAGVPAQLTEMTKKYQEDPAVKEAMKYFEQVHQDAQKS